MTACTGEARAMDVISDVAMKLLRDTLNPKWRTLRVLSGTGPNSDRTYWSLSTSLPNEVVRTSGPNKRTIYGEQSEAASQRVAHLYVKCESVGFWNCPKPDFETMAL
ncbi:hypothetical protein ETB97_000086 [Aspergillus alliaceus]|uniref:Uncharacterized protein n=1 Tax=Petromyces alliaceus TaxID=209559 RepID=A0A8H6EC58_PETAA|nr:hypothetical protein ETB97_000086 [Aspergillus burnettii]